MQEQKGNQVQTWHVLCWPLKLKQFNNEAKFWVQLNVGVNSESDESYLGAYSNNWKMMLKKQFVNK